MYGNLVIGTWVDISEGCPMKFSVSGSDAVHVMLGESSRDGFELAFDVAALRSFAQLSSKAVAEMDAIYEQEEAERAAVVRGELEPST
ncbi:hypothetical protein [Actinokineospora sp.]|uniref:hypothetical protein n=1 Tax=Actinokineospora sp. TaxID=1872133 RepID=UPI00403793D5